MTQIEQMIKDMCPNGVEWKRLGEVCHINRGVRVIKSELESKGLYPVYQNSLTPLGYYEKFNYPANTTFIISAGAAGKVGYSNVAFWAADDCLCITCPDLLHSKFLYYCMTNKQDYFLSQVRHASVPRMSRNVVENFEIPIPPLEIQKKIVECLDKFSALAAELQAELQMRRKQYEYYRTHLLTPHSESNSAGDSTDDCNWEWKTLGEICVSIKDGMHNLPESTLIETDFPIISAQNIYDNKIDYVAKRYVDEETFIRENKRTNVEVGDVLLTIVATIGRSAVVKENRPVLLQRSVCVLKPNKDICPEFLKFSLDTNRVQSYMIANAHGAAQAGLYLNQVEQIKIALPSLAEQRRIADLLGKFDKLTTSLSDGIPAEQVVQQKRYEYYRDLLLTFPHKAV